MSKSIIDVVSDVSIISKTSKTGNPYNVLQVTFTNGERDYILDFYLDKNVYFALDCFINK